MTHDARAAAAGDAAALAEPDPVRRFVAALPAHVRDVLAIDYRLIRAVRACAERGVDLAELAELAGRGTEDRSVDDRRRLARFRVLREAGHVEGLS